MRSCVLSLWYLSEAERYRFAKFAHCLLMTWRVYAFLPWAEMFSFASISRPGCKDRLPHGPNIFSPHLQVLPAFIHDVIHDYFTDLKLTLAEVASKDPKGFIES